MAVAAPEVATGAAAPAMGRPRRGRWVVHVVAYLVLLLALLALIDLHHGWNLDDGAYGTQVRVLEQTGGWAYPYRHRAIDPESRYAPVSHATTTTTGAYPYAKLPAWIEVLRASSRVFGQPIGLYVPSVLGAVAAALLAAALAERLTPGLGTLAFWAVALGPIVLHTQALWAHTVAAALGAVAALVVVAIAQRRERWWHLASAGAAVVALVSVRNDGFLFAGALALVIGGLLLLRPVSWRDRLVRAAGWAMPVVVSAAGARWLAARWSERVAPGTPVEIPESQPGGSGFVSGRITGALRTFLDGVGGSGGATVMAVLVAALAVVGGVLLARRGQRAVDGAVMLACALVLAVARTWYAPGDLAGLLVAAPVVAAAIGAFDWRGASEAERALVALVAVHGLAVLATQYPEGGSRDWGGRFLFPVLVPATVVAVLTLARLVRPVLGGRRRLAAVALVAACALPTAAGLWAADDARRSFRDLDQLTARTANDVPTIVKIPRFLTRTGWSQLPGPDWLSADPDTARQALALLRPGRTEPIAVVGNGADRVRAPGYRRDVRSAAVVIFTPI